MSPASRVGRAGTVRLCRLCLRSDMGACSPALCPRRTPEGQALRGRVAAHLAYHGRPARSLWICRGPCSGAANWTNWTREFRRRHGCRRRRASGRSPTVFILLVVWSSGLEDARVVRGAGLRKPLPQRGPPVVVLVGTIEAVIASQSFPRRRGREHAVRLPRRLEARRDADGIAPDIVGELARADAPRHDW